MGYKPKSKVNIKETTGNEFIYKSAQNKPFSELHKGDYYRGSYIEGSDGSYFAGKNILYTHIQLVKPNNTYGIFGDSKDVNAYRRNTPIPFSKLKSTTDIFGHKNQPTSFDYQKGYYTSPLGLWVNERFG